MVFPLILPHSPLIVILNLGNSKNPTFTCGLNRYWYYKVDLPEGEKYIGCHGVTWQMQKHKFDLVDMINLGAAWGQGSPIENLLQPHILWQLHYRWATILASNWLELPVMRRKKKCKWTPPCDPGPSRSCGCERGGLVKLMVPYEVPLWLSVIQTCRVHGTPARKPIRSPKRKHKHLLS